MPCPIVFARGKEDFVTLEKPLNIQQRKSTIVLCAYPPAASNIDFKMNETDIAQMKPAYCGWGDDKKHYVESFFLRALFVFYPGCPLIFVLKFRYLCGNVTFVIFVQRVCSIFTVFLFLFFCVVYSSLVLFVALFLNRSVIFFIAVGLVYCRFFIFFKSFSLFICCLKGKFSGLTISLDSFCSVFFLALFCVR